MGGKVVLVTGGNAGIGKETAVQLATAGARVVITSRDSGRGAAALEDIRARSGNRDVHMALLDLASLASVRACADGIVERFERLDALVNNAGGLLARRTETADGFEATFGVNHLGHFLLTRLLTDLLVASEPARVVVVSSDYHRRARNGLDFDDLQLVHRYSGQVAYARSKLANILFARELARQMSGTGVTANALHPGYVATRFGRDGDTGLFGATLALLARPIMISASQGASTSVFLASSPEVEGVTGGYWARCAPHAPAPAALDDDAARRLWEVSEELVDR